MRDLVYKRKFKDGDLQAEVEVRLQKLGGNKYPYWSVTGTIRKGFGLNMEEICGAIGDKLIHFFPEIEPFERLHLSYGNGLPDYVETNGWYFKKTMNKKALKEIFRLTDEEIKKVMEVPDKESFLYYIHKNVEEKWHHEAEDLVKKMRELTGNRLELDEGEELGPIVMSEEEVRKHEERIAEGYYDTPAIEKRKDEKEKEEKEIALRDINRTYYKRKDDADNMFNLMQALIEEGVPYPCMLEVFANKEVLIYVDQLRGIDSYYPEEKFDRLYEKLENEDLIPEEFKVVKRKGF